MDSGPCVTRSSDAVTHSVLHRHTMRDAGRQFTCAVMQITVRCTTLRSSVKFCSAPDAEHCELECGGYEENGYEERWPGKWHFKRQGRVNVNTGKQNVSSGSLHVSSGTHIKSGTSSFNTGKQHVNSGSMYVNSGTKNKSGGSRVNTGKQNVNSGRVHVNTARVTSPVLSNQTSQVNFKSPKTCFSKQRSPENRPFTKNTAYKSNNYAVKGTMGTAVKTSAGHKATQACEGMGSPREISSFCMAHLEDYQELNKVGSVTFGGSKGSISGKERESNWTELDGRDSASRILLHPTFVADECVCVLVSVQIVYPTQPYISVPLLSDSHKAQRMQLLMMLDLRAELDKLRVQQKEAYANSTNRVSTISQSVSAIRQSFINVNDLPTDPLMLDLEDTTDFDDTRIFGNAYDDEDVGAEADFNNLETTMNVSPIPTTRIDKDHPKDQIIGDFNSAIQTRRMTKISDEHAMRAIGTKWVFRNKKDERGIVVRNKARQVAQGYTQEEGVNYDEMDVKSAFLYGTIDEEVYVCQPPGFEDPQFPDKVYKVEKALYGLHQAPKAWYETLSTYLIKNGFRRGTIDKTLFIKKEKGDILLVHVYVDDIIFGSTKKSLCDEFEGLMHKRFQMSSMGELTFFLGLQVQQKKDGIFISQDKYVADILKKFDFAIVKTTSTPMEPNKALIKDEEADSVDVHLYRSMIGSLMYLTASRPDIMFAVCACARFQVTPKMSHLHAVKRIFRYLKGQPKLGLWYPRDSPFDLEAFSDSDYARASLDRKSTTGGCQFLGKRLISWQCKKQTIVANSTTEAEYVAAANCCGQVLWIQNQMLDYGFNFMNTKIFIDNESTICIVKNPVFHSKTKHIKIRHHFIRDCYEKKLIQVIKIHIDHNVVDLLTKAFDVSRYPHLLNSTIKKPIIVPSSYPPKKTHIPRKAIRTTEISQSSGPINLVADETVYKEWEDRMERASTTASSLDAEQDSGAKIPYWEVQMIPTRFETASKQSNDPPLSRGYTLGSGEDNMKLLELMELCTKLSDLLEDVDGISSLPNTEIFEQLALIGQWLVQGPIQQGEGSTVLVESHHTPITTPSTSQPPLSSPSRVPTPPYDLPLPRVSTSSGEVSTASRIISIAEETVSTTGASMPVSTAKDCQQSEKPKLQEEIDAAERHRMAKVHQAAQGFTEDEWENIRARVEADEELTQKLQAEEREKYSEVDQAKMLVDLINQRKRFFAQQRGEAKRNKPMTQAQQKNLHVKLHQEPKRRVHSFVPMDSELEVQRLKRAGQEVLEEPAKRQKIGKASGSGEEQSAEKEKEVSEEELQKLLVIVPVEEVYIEAL
ncbi:putative ribonuclease H-like domain-containing protein [Tanacetum coccineum]|uniref:Ribonuclease H-like domain-containing protein n=1 Tax=Tanacetum coccineum TaxID=301880 RepID=A0ABQ5DBF6_9ASTR